MVFSGCATGSFQPGNRRRSCRRPPGIPSLLTRENPDTRLLRRILSNYAPALGEMSIWGSVTELVETGRGEGVRVQVFFLCSDVRDRSTGVQLGPGEAREVVRLLFARGRVLFQPDSPQGWGKKPVFSTEESPLREQGEDASSLFVGRYSRAGSMGSRIAWPRLYQITLPVIMMDQVTDQSG